MFWCKGKQPLTATDAKRRAEVQRKRHSGKSITSYKCSLCGRWHVGSTMKRRKKKIRSC